MTLAETLLALPAALYGAAVRLRNARYDRPGVSRRVSIPVVSVGNITLGGTGKTPVVAWIARAIQRAGLVPAVVSRGYGGTAGRGPLVVSTGGAPLCTAAECGDEPWWLARSLGGIVVVVGADRIAAARAAQGLGASAIVLDDGFQHRRLARDLDLVLLDAHDPFGGGRLLPAGRLREPPSGLGRADVVLVTRSRPGQRHPAIEREVRAHNARAALLSAGHRRLGFVDADGRAHPAPPRAVAFCGIGSPELFREDLLAEGVELARFVRFRDHHVFSSGERRELQELAAREAATLVTTEKDLARLERAGAGDAPVVLALRIEAVPFEPERLERLLRAAVGREAA